MNKKTIDALQVQAPSLQPPAAGWQPGSPMAGAQETQPARGNQLHLAEPKMGWGKMGKDGERWGNWDLPVENGDFTMKNEELTLQIQGIKQEK